MLSSLFLQKNWPFWWFHSSENLNGYKDAWKVHISILAFLATYLWDLFRIFFKLAALHIALLLQQEKNTSVSMQYLQCHFHSFIFDITLHLHTRLLGAKLLGIYNWNCFHCNTPTFKNLIKIMSWLLHYSVLVAWDCFVQKTFLNSLSIIILPLC